MPAPPLTDLRFPSHFHRKGPRPFFLRGKLTRSSCSGVGNRPQIRKLAQPLCCGTAITVSLHYWMRYKLTTEATSTQTPPPFQRKKPLCGMAVKREKPLRNHAGLLKNEAETGSTERRNTMWNCEPPKSGTWHNSDPSKSEICFHSDSQTYLTLLSM